MSTKKRKKKQKKTEADQASQMIIISSAKRKLWLRSSMLGTFFSTFIFYLLTLAPSISFEDSSELITAAYHLGVPHEPGYPLFTLLGKLFSLIIPLGNIAFRLNIMSAFFTSLSAAIITNIAVLTIEDVLVEKRGWKKVHATASRMMKFAAAVSAGLLFGFSFEVWEQAIMTEVYGLNNTLLATFILFALYWNRTSKKERKEKKLFLGFIIIGLAVTNHTTSLMLIPAFVVLVLATDYKMLFKIKNILRSIGGMVVGLLPFLYLPLSSKTNPPMDWGNPENFTNFLRVVTRHQYHDTSPKTMNGFINQSDFYFTKLLTEQWYAPFLILAVIGLVVLLVKNRNYFLFLFTLLLFSIPATTYLTNFDVTSHPILAIENGALVSVFYIPSYLLISVFMSLGVVFLLTRIKGRRGYYFISAYLMLIVPLSNIFKNYSKVDMSNYHYPQKYVNNVFKVTTENALIMGDWDVFCFPFIYYQFVEEKRKDIISIDITLLKRSWYIQWLREYYPDFIKQSNKEVDQFLTALAPFENHKPYNGNLIQQTYENMIHSFIQKHIESGNDVYFTNINKESANILKNYPRESLLAAYKIPTSNKLTEVEYNDLEVQYFLNETNSSDRFVPILREYYGSLLFHRAYTFEQLGEYENAFKYYSYALPFFKNKPQTEKALLTKIKQLSTN